MGVTYVDTPTTVVGRHLIEVQCHHFRGMQVVGCLSKGLARCYHAYRTKLQRFTSCAWEISQSS